MYVGTALFQGNPFLPPEDCVGTPPGIRRSAPMAPAASVAVRTDATGSAANTARRPLFAALWKSLHSALLWLDGALRDRTIEAYLARSGDHAELERRMRELDRVRQFNWTDCGCR